MTITIELPKSLQMQAEAYAATRGESMAELMLTSLQEFLTNASGSKRAIETKETDAEAEVWDQVFEEVMEEYADVWERLAQL